MPQLRSADDLAAVEDPAWPELVKSIADALVDVRVLDVPPAQARRVLYRLQVTARSVLGALALNCGGLVVDHGWVRVLGGGTVELPDLAEANGLAEPDQTSSSPPCLLVAFDVLGGQFAIDGGGLGVNAGEVCYRGPDTLTWDGLGAGHAAFVMTLLAGGLEDFYASLRWPGWEGEVGSIPLSSGLGLYPPPFTAEGKDIASTSRRQVPFQELLYFYDSMATQLAQTDEAAPFVIRVE